MRNVASDTLEFISVMSAFLRFPAVEEMDKLMTSQNSIIRKLKEECCKLGTKLEELFLSSRSVTFLIYSLNRHILYFTTLSSSFKLRPFFLFGFLFLCSLTLRFVPSV